MALLGEFLARGAITRGQYEKSAGVLKEKFAAGPGGSGEDKRLSKQLAFILEADRLQEITRQTRNIFATFAQRWQMDTDNVQAVE